MGDGGKVSLKLKFDSKARLEFRGASMGAIHRAELSNTRVLQARLWRLRCTPLARGSSSLDSASFISPTNEASPTFDSDLAARHLTPDIGSFLIAASRGAITSSPPITP